MPVIPDTSHARTLHDKAWAETYPLIDRQLSPLGLEAIKVLGLHAGDTVLDIGCGTGQTLLQLADIVGTAGRVIGADIAPTLLKVAAQRTSDVQQIELLETDAQSLPLQSASADAVFSRFGVMGFTDPIAAFTNLRRILKPSGTLAFVCWRGLDENELDAFPLRAAQINLPTSDTPFSFVDPEVIHRTLSAAGFTDICIDPFDTQVSSGSLDDMTQVLMKIGPLGKIMRETPDLQVRAEQRLRCALATKGELGSVALTAGVWIVSAQ